MLEAFKSILGKLLDVNKFEDGFACSKELRSQWFFGCGAEHYRKLHRKLFFTVCEDELLAIRDAANRDLLLSKRDSDDDKESFNFKVTIPSTAKYDRNMFYGSEPMDFDGPTAKKFIDELQRCGYLTPDTFSRRCPYKSHMKITNNLNNSNTKNIFDIGASCDYKEDLQECIWKFITRLPVISYDGTNICIDITVEGIKSSMKGE